MQKMSLDHHKMLCEKGLHLIAAIHCRQWTTCV